jgi:hypothetical protein
MGHLSYLTLHDYVKINLSQTTIPSGLVRRLGADQYKDKVLQDFIRRFGSINQLLEDSIIDSSKATTMLASLVNELTSFLYAVGASHYVWRHWSSLTAFGLFLSGEIHRAAQYAALGGEWRFLEVLPDQSLKSQQEADRVTWMLLSGKPPSNLPEVQDEYTNAWLGLSRSIPSKDHKMTEDCLKTIADFWMEETEGDWNNFCNGRYPVFETPICAMAALARHQGFVPTSLDVAQHSFLEAGLAEPEPPCMFPTLFSLPESPRSNR